MVSWQCSTGNFDAFRKGACTAGSCFAQEGCIEGESDRLTALEPFPSYLNTRGRRSICWRKCYACASRMRWECIPCNHSRYREYQANKYQERDTDEWAEHIIPLFHQCMHHAENMHCKTFQ